VWVNIWNTSLNLNLRDKYSFLFMRVNARCEFHKIMRCARISDVAFGPFTSQSFVFLGLDNVNERAERVDEVWWNEKFDSIVGLRVVVVSAMECKEAGNVAVEKEVKWNKGIAHKDGSARVVEEGEKAADPFSAVLHDPDPPVRLHCSATCAIGALCDMRDWRSP
jgi:hypothetical protein